MHTRKHTHTYIHAHTIQTYIHMYTHTYTQTPKETSRAIGRQRSCVNAWQLLSQCSAESLPSSLVILPQNHVDGNSCISHSLPIPRKASWLSQWHWICLVFGTVQNLWMLLLPNGVWQLKGFSCKKMLFQLKHRLLTLEIWPEAGLPIRGSFSLKFNFHIHTFIEKLPHKMALVWQKGL